MKVYKANSGTGAYYIIVFAILFGVTIFFSSRSTNNSWPLLIIFLLLFVVFNFTTFRLNEVWVEVINTNLTLVYKNYIGIKRALKYDLDKIEFTYKRQAISLRGGIKNVCSIYYTGRKVAKLTPGNDDWSDEEIRGLVYGLLDAQVKKKIVGYNLKDVEM